MFINSVGILKVHKSTILIQLFKANGRLVIFVKRRTNIVSEGIAIRNL